MSLLRRIVVVGRVPQIQAVAQELAREVFVADDLGEAATIVSTVGPDLTIFDGTWTPAQVRDHLQQIAADSTQPGRTVVVTSDGGPFSESDYRQAGVSDCFTGPADLTRLRDFAAELDAAARRPADTGIEAQTYFVDETAAVALAGCSPAIHLALQMIKLVAASRCNPVLVTGDTGTGKEVAARAVHHLRHPGQPFVAVNCAALTANLLESELFGHVKGSFTGADRDKTGLLEMAEAGTIFLDEISEMPLDLQAKLLRILQEKTFRKVGGVRDLDCKATIIASSNRDLKKEVREKRFRQDLYYRLNICPIQLTPLRSPQRRQDIPLLATYFLKTSSICSHRENRVASITQLALEALGRYDWPGNVRELRNVIERAILLETTDKIGLSSIIIDPIDSDEPPHAGLGRSGKDFSLEKAERELIARALHETGWQKTQAAALLGITRATLYAKVKQYDIRKEGPAVEEVRRAAPQPFEAVGAAAY
ncbi:MAG: sigma-54 dependent transcriptional regulator [Phycisphaerae bacterium]|nr:sigma-54 dependent transcriptional regulator [Phycisphaerae bacterium]